MQMFHNLGLIISFAKNYSLFFSLFLVILRSREVCLPAGRTESGANFIYDGNIGGHAMSEVYAKFNVHTCTNYITQALYACFPDVMGENEM